MKKQKKRIKLINLCKELKGKDFLAASKHMDKLVFSLHVKCASAVIFKSEEQVQKHTCTRIFKHEHAKVAPHILLTGILTSLVVYHFGEILQKNN